ncbi:hypothetical protein HNP84_002957 [Thermocatellispora tengchongensis]|uniref:Secreted protein n=1 Tax=Thermocatellispora tengchongensis TaxID=1073253 RepID=A0A840P3Z6_9ACTN|nr:hypothetical protein [Thermocatellispora tengchongensis]MBB5133236.1 hypothetical protein [Thermocatellispora tengchongensis]
MIKKLCVAGAVLAAAAGAVLVTSPAHADDWRNWSNNTDSAQSGNLFGQVSSRNAGTGQSTNVNNLNGVAGTASNGSVTVTYVFD